MDLLKRIDTFYKKACQIEDLTMVVTQGSRPLLISPDLKEWDESDMRWGSAYDFFSSDLLNSLHLLYVDTDYRDFFKFNLSEGDYFEEVDYLYEKDYVPVLMGADFKKYFSLGEVFEARDYPLEKKQYKVIGFIAENQYFSCANMPDRIYKYDNFIIAPYIEKDLFEMIGENSGYDRFLDLFTSRFVQFSFFIIKSESYETVREELKDLLDETGLDIYFTFYRHRVEKELASNFKDQLAISVVVCVTTLLFSLFSLVFTMLYKIDDNMKNYAIRMVVGETYGGIAFRYLFESFAVFLLGQITGFFAFKIYAVNSYIYQGYDYLEAPTLRTGIILNIAFYVITAIILYICIKVKLKTYSLATLIRGNEVKKEKRMPFYRVAIFCMLAIVGVFSMFIASYLVALDRIDLYYMGYYTKNVKIAYVLQRVGEDSLEAVVDIDAIGAEAN
ncbi:MAG: ABC transporter permease, partial [Clostridia bacterium]|nr:ABC transporter permease [Clostridia bacterium]